MKIFSLAEGLTASCSFVPLLNTGYEHVLTQQTVPISIGKRLVAVLTTNTY